MTVARVPGVYVLKFASGRLYVGASLDVHKRVASHERQLQKRQHHLAYLQAESEACGARWKFEIKPIPVVDAYELQVVERVMIRLMVQRYGRRRVLNEEWDPRVILSRKPIPPVLIPSE